MAKSTSMLEQIDHADGSRIVIKNASAVADTAHAAHRAPGDKAFWSGLRDLVEYESAQLANTYDQALDALVWPYLKQWGARGGRALAVQLERDWDWLYRETKVRAAPEVQPVATRIDEYS